MLRARRLHRARELLALAVQPDHQVAGKGGCQSADFWALAGRPHAPRQRQRAPTSPHGLLHRPAVRLRRLHRRLAALRARRQRVPAAVPGPQQRSPAGATASGTRSSPASGRPAAVVPEPAVHDARHEPRPRARSRSSTSTRRAVQRLRPVVRNDSSGHTWAERPDAGPVDPARASSSSPSPTTAPRRSTPRSPRARTCSSPRASTTSTRRST